MFQIAVSGVDPDELTKMKFVMHTCRLARLKRSMEFWKLKIEIGLQLEHGKFHIVPVLVAPVRPMNRFLGILAASNKVQQLTLDFFGLTGGWPLHVLRDRIWNSKGVISSSRTVQPSAERSYGVLYTL